LTFEDSCTEYVLPITAKFSVLEQTNSIRLHAKSHIDRFILATSGCEKAQFLGHCLPMT